jgi:hypothetical protein
MDIKHGEPAWWIVSEAASQARRRGPWSWQLVDVEPVRAVDVDRASGWLQRYAAA